MRIREIILFLKDYIFLGITIIIILGLLFLIGYKFIYQKLMHGNKKISKKNLLLYGISICYFAVVYGAVFLNRVNLYDGINLNLFSSYLEAYHNMSPSLFRNLILNILLFVPLGIFLPLYTKKLNKVYKVVPIGFLLTLLIEIIQYKTNFGIFEIDDIFNNTFGVLMGYGLYKVYNNIKNKEKKIYLIGYLTPMIILIFSFLVINITYQNKELGNLPFEYNYKINMKNVNLTNTIELDNIKENKPIYYLKTLTEKETRKQANNFYKNLDTSVREDDIKMYIYEDSAIYNSKDSKYSMWINYADGSYTFNDFSNFNKDIDIKTGVSKEEVISALNKIGISIPDSAIFEEQNYSYIFNVNIKSDNSAIEGKLTCAYYTDNTIKRVENNIVEYKKIKDKEIISEKEAYNEIINGRFQYENYIGKINEIIVESVELKYYLDTKGYYVPIYAFNAKINEFQTEILIKAIK